MAITLRQLEIFVRVATEEHATKASEKLHVSQSAISMALAELERLTGGSLFERVGRRLVLNERGRLLLPEARDVLRRVAGIEELLRESDEPVGLLRVGASTTIGNYLLPSLVAKFAARHRQAQIQLQVGNTKQIEEAVSTGELDLGLIEGPSHAFGLDRIPWRDDELVVVAGPHHPWAGEQRADAAMLEAAGWIMREEGSGTREVFEAAMAQVVNSTSITLELGHTEAIKKAVEAGLGVSCLSRLAVRREIEQGWLVGIDTPLDLRRTLAILVRKSAERTKLFTAFVEQLMQVTPD